MCSLFSNFTSNISKTLNVAGVQFQGVNLRSCFQLDVGVHFQTSVFTPAHGTVTSVRVTSLVPAPEVINLLLDKFKVQDKTRLVECLQIGVRSG